MLVIGQMQVIWVMSEALSVYAKQPEKVGFQVAAFATG